MEHTNMLSAIADEFTNSNGTIKGESLKNALNSCGLENVWGEAYTGNMSKVVKGAYIDLLKKAEKIRKLFVDESGKPYFASYINENHKMECE